MEPPAQALPTAEADQHIRPEMGFGPAVALLGILLALLWLDLRVEEGGRFQAIGEYVESPARPFLQVALLAPLAVGLLHTAVQLHRSQSFAWTLPMGAFLLLVPALLLAWSAEGPAQPYPYSIESDRCAGGGFVPTSMADYAEPFVAYAMPVVVIGSVAAGTAAWFRDRLRAVGVWTALAGFTGLVLWLATGVLYNCP